jgi:hypothetical protein
MLSFLAALRTVRVPSMVSFRHLEDDLDYSGSKARQAILAGGEAALPRNASRAPGAELTRRLQSWMNLHLDDYRQIATVLPG